MAPAATCTAASEACKVPGVDGRLPAPSGNRILLAATAAALAVLLVLRIGAAGRGGPSPPHPSSPLRLAGDGSGGVPGGTADLAAARALLADWPPDKPKACIFILARNSDLAGVLSSVGQLERRFNRQYNYPYCYLNDQPFSPAFRSGAAAASAAPSFFGRVPREHWSYPPHINASLAAQRRAEAKGRMPYGGSESYRFMCRYFSGFFFDHPLLEGFEFYWRVEPGVHFMCDLQEDPLRHMQRKNHSLAWTIMMSEVPATIPTLWAQVQRWLAANPHNQAPNNLLPAFLEEEGEGEGQEEDGEEEQGGDEPAAAVAAAAAATEGQLAARTGGGSGGGSSSSSSGSSGGGSSSSSSSSGGRRRQRYTGCHMWSNFEIGRLAFFRSPAYRQLFQHLDRAGGFFYERWGDAPVHTLAAAALLDRRAIHFAGDVGYAHGSWSHCPSQPSDRSRCDCNPLWDAHVLAQPRCQLDFNTRLAALVQRGE